LLENIKIKVYSFLFNSRVQAKILHRHICSWVVSCHSWFWSETLIRTAWLLTKQCACIAYSARQARFGLIVLIIIFYSPKFGSNTKMC